jgi:hypothetical protein
MEPMAAIWSQIPMAPRLGPATSASSREIK